MPVQAAAATNASVGRLTRSLSKNKRSQSDASFMFEKLPPKMEFEGDMEISMKAHGYEASQSFPNRLNDMKCLGTSISSCIQWLFKTSNEL